MRYRLPFAIAPPVNWSQLPAARLITLVPKSPPCALLVDAWASTPRPGSLGRFLGCLRWSGCSSSPPDFCSLAPHLEAQPFGLLKTTRRLERSLAMPVLQMLRNHFSHASLRIVTRNRSDGCKL